MSYVVVIRSGPKVERRRTDTLEDALETVERAGRALATGPRRQRVDLKVRTYEPGDQIAHRVELARAGLMSRVLGGIDVRGDGSQHAWTGWTRRRELAREGNETGYDALRRALL